jgi:hypothetical protein
MQYLVRDDDSLAILSFTYLVTYFSLHLHGFEHFIPVNFVDAIPITQRFSYQAVVGAGYGVDTFYMIRYSCLSRHVDRLAGISYF